MKNLEIKIDFGLLKLSFRQFTLEKAKKANSTIVYAEGKFIVEENPKTGEKRILKPLSSS